VHDVLALAAVRATHIAATLVRGKSGGAVEFAPVCAIALVAAAARVFAAVTRAIFAAVAVDDIAEVLADDDIPRRVRPDVLAAVVVVGEDPAAVVADELVAPGGRPATEQNPPEGS
jgi:hypothetical protein